MEQKNSSRMPVREPGFCRLDNLPVHTVPSWRRKVKRNGAEAPFFLRDYTPLKARLGVLEIGQEVHYAVGIHKRYMGIRGHPGSRRETYRAVWCKRAEERKKEESHSGGYKETKPMEKREGYSAAYQMEF